MCSPNVSEKEPCYAAGSRYAPEIRIIKVIHAEGSLLAAKWRICFMLNSQSHEKARWSRLVMQEVNTKMKQIIARVLISNLLREAA